MHVMWFVPHAGNPPAEAIAARAIAARGVPASGRPGTVQGAGVMGLHLHRRMKQDFRGKNYTYPILTGTCSPRRKPTTGWIAWGATWARATGGSGHGQHYMTCGA